MKKLLLLSLLLMSCITSDDSTKKAVQALGMTSIVIGGPSFLACGEDDMTGRKFTAVNPAGTTVSGTVCCGVFKGCTVRF